MEARQVLEEFDRLVREADRLEEDIFAPLPDREAVHQAALELVLQHPEMRSQFAAKFVEMLGRMNSSSSSTACTSCAGRM